ncbi:MULTISPECIES: ferredoxin [unclassified Dietzia]|uniref:ferredoxin n=1 Tax=unclassified Dietzia TaxID=2617939 RepID=UPI0015FB8EE4|nr:MULTISPECIES: ferredoxin [unclassified Dietzia]MBB1024958.1 ferredoxin [Dietzia sp. DQ12-76]MBB1028428.1 ferredoxin [Dietzia sp. DQ11-38-2]
MKISIDPDRCEGQAVCVGLAPKVFALGDDDEVVRLLVEDVPEDLQKRARKAIEKCPMAALRETG